MLSDGQEKRRKRSKMVVAVRIMPATADGGTGELVHTLDVSAAGARLGGIRAPLKPGDVLRIQRDRQKASCTVIWARAAGTKEMQIGIELIDSNERFWGLDLSH
ncbi:MAG: hypothetical protein NVS1B11_34260 [Terriglobales bacterium]